MKATLLIAVFAAACGATPPRAPDYAPLPDDPRLPPSTKPAAATTTTAGESDPTCLPAGEYEVVVNLSTAVITQAHTGMDDTVWCKSMLEQVPAHMMAAMTIGYDGGTLAVEWPSGQPSQAWPRGPCSFEITAPPIPATFTFAGGQGSATATYSIGTENHPDESCTATGAKISVVPLGAP